MTKKALFTLFTELGLSPAYSGSTKTFFLTKVPRKILRSHDTGDFKFKKSSR